MFMELVDVLVSTPLTLEELASEYAIFPKEKKCSRSI